MLYGDQACHGSLPRLPDDVRPNTSVEIRPNPTAKMRPVGVSLPIVLDGKVMHKVDPSDGRTAGLGFIKRVVNPLPSEIDEDVLIDFGLFVKQYLIRNLVPLSPDSDVSVSGWLARAPYPAHRKEELLRLDPKEVANYREHIMCKSFGKDEFYPESKHMRTINPRDDYFKVFSGPIFSLIEKEVFKNPVFIKKVSMPERPDYIRNRVGCDGATYLCTDYTSFESSFTLEFMTVCELQLYEYMSSYVEGGREWYRAISEALPGDQNLIHTNVSVRTIAGRCSGDMCTSLGNGFSNLMLMEYAAHVLKLGTLYGVFEGDDGLCRFSSGKMPDSDFFLKLGFRVKMIVTNSLSEASFCGMVFDDVGMQNIRDPRPCLANFGWTSARYVKSRRSKLMGLMRSKALSGLYENPGCPVLSVFYERVLHLTRGCDTSWIIRKGGLNNWERGWLIEAQLWFENHDKRAEPPCVETRRLFENQYGLDIELQRALETRFASLNLGTFHLNIDLPASWSLMWEDHVVQNPIDLSFPCTLAQCRALTTSDLHERYPVLASIEAVSAARAAKRKRRHLMGLPVVTAVT